MHGEISASSLGRNLGSTFKVTFPVFSQTRAQSPPRELAVTQPINPQRILLVEDNKSTALVMMKFLRNFGHEVKIAYCVKEAMEIARENKFDFVISDIGLPDGSGYDLMAKLKSIYGLRGICKNFGGKIKLMGV